jgi:glucose/arabinose dehydrogenase
MSRITSASALLAFGLLALLAPGVAAAAPALVPVGDFDAPIHAAAPPQDPSRLFVVERGGTVRVVRNGVVLPRAFLDISKEVATDGERGLLSIAFPPDYASSGLFYVYMVAAVPAGELQVREYRRSAGDPDRADLAGRIVWSQAHPNDNHNGGQVQFDTDGHLWFATGDGGGETDNDPGNDAQSLASQLGKLLRIDPHPSGAGAYGIPAENPYPGSPVWASGLRNPFRFSFDRELGDLVIGDVGGGREEEIDWAPTSEGLRPRANYGWSCREGTLDGPRACDPGAAYLPPAFAYEQASPRAVTGGFVVRDPGLPTLRGRYLYADAFAGQVRSLVLGRPATGDRPEAGLQRAQLVSFAEDACGRLYVVSLAGTVDRIQDGAPGECHLRPLTTVPAVAAVAPIPDRSPPRVRIAIVRRGRVGLRATPRIALTADERCRVTVTARVARVKLKRVRTPLPAGRRIILRLRPSHRGVRRIRKDLRRHRRLTLSVSVTADDAAGNTARAQRRMKIRRG